MYTKLPRLAPVIQIKDYVLCMLGIERDRISSIMHACVRTDLGVVNMYLGHCPFHNNRLIKLFANYGNEGRFEKKKVGNLEAKAGHLPGTNLVSKNHHF